MVYVHCVADAGDGELAGIDEGSANTNGGAGSDVHKAETARRSSGSALLYTVRRWKLVNTGVAFLPGV